MSIASLGHARRSAGLQLTSADVIVYREGDYAIAVDTKTRQVILKSKTHNEVLSEVINEIDKGRIYVSSGEYVFDDTVVISKENIEIAGAGGGWLANDGATKIIAPSGKPAIEFRPPSGSSMIRACSVRNLTIVGQGLKLVNAHHFLLERVHVRGFDAGEVGILIDAENILSANDYSSFNTLLQCSTYGLGTGVKLTATTGYKSEVTLFLGGSFYGLSSTSKGEVGIDIDKGDYNRVIGSLIAYQAKGIRVADANNDLDTPSLENCDTGISIEASVTVFIGKPIFNSVTTPIDRGTYTPTIVFTRGLGTWLFEQYYRTVLPVKSSRLDIYDETQSTLLAQLGYGGIGGLFWALGGIATRVDVGDYGGAFANYTPPAGAEGRIVIAIDTNATTPGQRIYVYANGAWHYVDLT